MSNSSKTQVALRLPNDLIEKADRLAVGCAMSRSEILREFLRAGCAVMHSETVEVAPRKRARKSRSA